MRVVPREMSELNPVPECSYCVPGRFFICGPDSRLMSMEKKINRNRNPVCTRHLKDRCQVLIARRECHGICERS
ncbi:hypothetical protein CLOBOL_01136 [Enterocloster bolteae ATCC BAA-613]|uniref:Uncharacterized protein n=1 Tax=Enterocloster bolteae (strain ATCC BAA-613 / DSM 15670 / CCUG 46953 / JCM 12243 / WAL 16351) TaxID=411902 RepID=A8RJ86_ENTBW|nr:hypothetical protein CLOBOL_01136 [Enterocloster bolteae ATCC BAA-613]